MALTTSLVLSMNILTTFIFSTDISVPIVNENGALHSLNRDTVPSIAHITLAHVTLAHMTVAHMTVAHVTLANFKSQFLALETERRSLSHLEALKRDSGRASGL